MIQIALAFSNQSATELESLGFKKAEVYIRPFYLVGKTKDEARAAGDSEFFTMNNIPFQFATTDYWGMGPE